MLTEAEVVSAGMTDSFLKAAHPTRTRHAHQVTLLALHHLRSEAFELVTGSTDAESLEDWRNCMVEKSNLHVLGANHEI